MPRFPSLEKNKGRRIPWVLVGVVLCVSFVFVSYFSLRYWYHAPLKSLNEAIVFEFERGTSLDRLSQKLREVGLLKHPRLFKLSVKLFDDYPQFKAGTYLIESGDSYASFGQKLESGRIHDPIILQFAIPEGFSKDKIAARLVANGIGTKEDYEAIWADQAFLQELGIASYEGYLYPATYSFRKLPSPREMIKQMVKTFFEKLPADYDKLIREKNPRYALHEGVIFASMIEKETGHVDEMTKVSEVIWRRLKRGWPLGIDASVIYGIDGYDGNIRFRDLKNPKNPYNTRIHKGLPPSPICSPSYSALMAVLNPSDEGYYFYVLEVDSGGRHYFSKTLAEHNRYVEKLVNATKSTSSGRN